MAKKDDALKTASVLAFERKLDPSDALLYAGQWSQRDALEDWQAVSVREKSVRGTISNRLKAKEQDPAKLDAAIENPNLQTVDVATLSHDADTLMARFTLRVLGGAGTPSACNNADYQAKLQQAVADYVKTEGFSELARRYAHNLANGRFLWRNRVGAEQVEVRIRRMEKGHVDKEWTFDALSLSLRGFESDTHTAELAQDIADALAGERHLILEVIAFAHVGNGQEVFPSQELILERGRGDKSKTLYSVDGVAAIHSQKLGNAIRTIDTWYPAPEDGSDLGPIAVEPYGSVTTQGTAYRQPKQKVDFYSLLDNWMLKDQVPETEQQHFVMATLIRGGVFGEAG
ncbi:type I-F CRISPR-associated protein Csy3 [Halomonas elongata]|uniref:CRISPR-associated protein Csy3 n=1 Tax=Halomonas elongata (strain ATCC 33173 / DSM 2581 / NBRC 15536 / NCIMB 2198 / 1H9) TaxID=768066 RepID=E1V4U1_HALED|nr:type I-F CRISPR-associated protein Csy3 [Halomonas elongata]WBF18230.1 type I-F CRISPR-associated protein Csy3 [Halomonas elongata]WPU47081.1 type I-F CRISPR-associated protein Csy3 [Halomonas elongata DSM 2581]CBV40990.1 CRISPR-associated protein Csy3 [Halomonas elongata DSM 2581]